MKMENNQDNASASTSAHIEGSPIDDEQLVNKAVGFSNDYINANVNSCNPEADLPPLPAVKKKKKKGVGFAVLDEPEVLASQSVDAAKPAKKGVGFAIMAGDAERELDSKKKQKGVGFAATAIDDEGDSHKIKKGVGFAGVVDNVDGVSSRSNGSGKKIRIMTTVDGSDELSAHAAQTPTAVTLEKENSGNTFGIVTFGVSAADEHVLETNDSFIELAHAESSPSASSHGSHSGSGAAPRFTFDDVEVNASMPFGKSTLAFDGIDDSLIAKDEEAHVVSRPSSAGSTMSTRSYGNDASSRESKEKDINNNGSGSNPPEVPFMASAAQFRRMERANRRYSIASDVWCGIEDTRHVWADAAWLAGSTCLLPLLVAILCYSSWTLNTDESSSNRVLCSLTLALTFVSQAVLLVEAFSSVVFEVEFGVVVSEEIPALYVYSAFWGVVLSVAVQQLMFVARTPIDGNGIQAVATTAIWGNNQRWIWQLVAGFIGCAAPVIRAFYTHAPSMLNIEMRRVFLNWLGGCCTCMLILPLLYLTYASLFSQYGIEGSGVVGALLALFFPAIRVVVKIFVDTFFHWGEGRARLFSGPTLDLLVDSLHSAFLCLMLCSTVCATVDVILLLFSQSCFYIWQILQLQSPSNGISLLNAQNICGGCCTADSRIGVKDSPATTPSKYNVMTDIENGGTESSSGGSSWTGGISADAMERYAFDKQCSKLREATALQCSLLTGALITTVITLFACVLSFSANRAMFEQVPGLWQLQMDTEMEEGGISSTMQNLLVLMAFQWLILISVFSWMQSNGNAIGIIMSQLVFYYTTMMAAVAIFAVLVVIGSMFLLNGVNAPF